MYLVLVAVHAHPHAFLNVGRSHSVRQVHHELGELLHIDDVFGILAVRVDDLGASNIIDKEIEISNLATIAQTYFVTWRPAEVVPTAGTVYQQQDPTKLEEPGQCRTP